MRRIFLLTIFLGTLLYMSCGNPTGPSYSNTGPADHTVSKSGVRHKPGLTNPVGNCVECHGNDLKGGSGPSCYACHGKQW